MTRPNERRRTRGRGLAAALLLLLAASSGVHVASAAGEDEVALELWDDPRFQREFLGSYGVQAEIEPDIDEEEREFFRELLPLLSVDDRQAAIERLEAFRTEREPQIAADEGEEPKKKRRRRDQDEGTKDEDGPSAVVYFTLANLYYQTERLDDAVAMYDAAIERFPTFRRAYKNLGGIHVREGRFEEAARALSRVIQLGGGDGQTYGLLGWSYNSIESYVAGEGAFRNAMLLQPEVLDWRLGLTQAVLKQNKYAEAVALCEQLIEDYPDREQFWLLQANAFIGLDQPMKAAENFEILDRMGKASAASMHTLGDIYVNEGLWDLGVRSYGRALTLDPDQGPDRALRNVEVLAQRGALSQSRRLLNTTKQALAGRIGDEERHGLLKLEARLAVAEGAGGEAVAVLQEIVALDPLDGEALILLGQHFAGTDETEQAEFYYERAQGIEGFEADAKVRHAQLLVEQARYGEALPLLERAQQLDPREDVGKFLEQVQRVARAAR